MEKQPADLESDDFKWSYFLWSHHKDKREFHKWLESQSGPIRRPAKRNPVTNPIIGGTP